MNNKAYDRMRQRFRLIKDVQPNIFCDLAVTIIKKYLQSSSTSVGAVLELYVTDFTENQGLIDRERPTGSIAMYSNPWPGPFGKLTLKVEVVGDHATTAHVNTSEGSNVRLKNVRIKLSSTGELEGNIFPDYKFPDRRPVMLETGLNHQDFIDLEERRRKYDALQTKILAQERQAAIAKANPARAPNVRSGFEENDLGSNDRSKKRNEKSKKRKHNSIEAPASVPTPQEKSVGANGTAEVETLKSAPKSRLNPHISSLGDEIPYSTFDDIIRYPKRSAKSNSRGVSFELPFINVTHHVVARVVDFFPHRLEEFCCQYQTDPSSGATYVKPEWNFWLVLESGNKRREETEHNDYRINVRVCGHDASTFLGLSPKEWHNYYEDKPLAALTMLREKLFLLWGDLEEKKIEFLQDNPEIPADKDFSATKYDIHASNLPFACGIGEGGVHAPGTDKDAGLGYRRVYTLMETTIKKQVTPSA